MARTPNKPDEIPSTVPERLKQLRTERGWSLEQLAQLCDVSRSMLSQIERGQANPTLGVAIRIAGAFGLTIGELVGEATQRSSAIHVIRHDDPAHHYRSDENVSIRTLSPLKLEKDVEFYEVALKAGGELKSAPHFAGTREFLTVQQGKVSVDSAADRVELARGDSASYPADVSHRIVNLGKSEALMFLVVIYK
jgi:transcriptional regulator with XRE-family HTH domain